MLGKVRESEYTNTIPYEAPHSLDEGEGVEFALCLPGEWWVTGQHLQYPQPEHGDNMFNV